MLHITILKEIYKEKNYARIQDVSSEAHRRWMEKREIQTIFGLYMKFKKKRQFSNNARIADGKFQYLNYNF